MTPENLEGETLIQLVAQQATVNTFMNFMTFTDFLKDQRPHSAQANTFPDEITGLPESFSQTVVKTAAVGILVKMNQLRRNVEQDRNAISADKSLASMLFLLSSMLATAIGGMSDEPGSVSRNGRSGAR